MQTVIIVTHPRSGSTLLNGILNDIDGWHLQGHKSNFTFHLFQSFQGLRKNVAKNPEKTRKPVHPLYGTGTLNLDSYARQLRGIIFDTLLSGQRPEGTLCRGFKDTSFLQILDQDPSGEVLHEYLEFLQTCLAPCKLIMLTRRPEETAKSVNFKSQDQDTVIAQLTAFKQATDAYAQPRKDTVFTLGYDDLIAGPNALSPMFDFLGARPAPERLEKILNTPHGPNPVSFQINRAPKPTQTGFLIEEIKEADKQFNAGQIEAAKARYRHIVDQYIANGHDTILQRVTKRAGRRDFRVRLSDTHKIAFFPVPKNASSTVSHLIYEVEHDAPYEALNVHKFYQHGIAYLSIENLADYWKFVIVREPIDRFVSGYRNRIIFHQDLLRVANYRGEIPDINEFALRLDEFMSMDAQIRGHFQPQTVRLGHDLTIYDAVFAIEDLSKLASQLSRRTGRQLSLGHSQTGGPKMNKTALNREALEHLNSFFAADYAALADHYPRS